MLWGVILRMLGEAFVHYFFIRRRSFLFVRHPWSWVEARPVRVKVLCMRQLRSYAQSMNALVYIVNIDTCDEKQHFFLDLFLPT